MNPLPQPDLHPDADQLNALMEDALPTAERQETLAHLAVCPDCRAVVAFAVAALPDAAPAAMPDARAVAGGAVSRWLASLAGLGTGWRVGAPAAVFALLLLFVVVRLHKPEPPPTGPGAVTTAVVEPPPLPAAPAATSAPGVRAQAAEPARKAATVDAAKPLAGMRAAQAPPVGRSASVSAGAEKEAAAGVVKQAPDARQVDRSVDRSTEASITRAPPEPRIAAAPAPMVIGMAGAAADGLPSRLPVLSRTASGARVVAIDAGNRVFASSDGGRTWTAVRPPWPGRALRVEGVLGAAEQVEGRSFASAAAQPMPAPQGSVGVASQRAALPEQKQEQASSATQATAASTAGGSVRGEVADVSGAAIPQATVTLRGGSGAPALTAKTDGGGKFQVDGLAPGAYQAQAAARGFASASVPVEVKPGATSSAALTLSPGSASQTVEVNSDASVVTADAARSIDALLPSRSARRQAVFSLTTDRGEHWVSGDGVHWSKR